MAKSTFDMKLKSAKDFDALFGGTDSNVRDGVQQIPLDSLQAYPKHPFKPYPKEKLSDLAESIRDNGLIHPITVVPAPENLGQYIILAGHNRADACRSLRMKVIDAHVLEEITEESADLIVVQSNLMQREKLLHSEKARAYRMQNDALKRQGKRTDLTSSPMGTKSSAASEVASRNEENRTNVFRYIRLNDLIEPLLDDVDSEKLPLRAGVELSYLSKQSQTTVHTYFAASKWKIDIETAKQLRRLEERTGNDLAEGDIEPFLNTIKKEAPLLAIKITTKKLGGMLEGVPAQEQEDYIVRAIKFFQANQGQ